MAAANLYTTSSASITWVKLALPLDKSVRNCLLDVFHKEGEFAKEPSPHMGLPKDPKQLYQKLNEKAIFDKLKKLSKKGIIKKDQWDLLFPANQETDSSKFDITLLVSLIRNFNGIKTKNGKFKVSELDASDQSVLGFALKAVELRNKMFHLPITEGMPAADVNEFWDDMKSIADGLRYKGNIEDFKDITLYADMEIIMKLFASYYEIQSDFMKKEMTENLKDMTDVFCKRMENFDKKLDSQNDFIKKGILYKGDQEVDKMKEDLKVELCKSKEELMIFMDKMLKRENMSNKMEIDVDDNYDDDDDDSGDDNDSEYDSDGCIALPDECYTYNSNHAEDNDDDKKVDVDDNYDDDDDDSGDDNDSEYDSDGCIALPDECYTYNSNHAEDNDDDVDDEDSDLVDDEEDDEEWEN